MGKSDDDGSKPTQRTKCAIKIKPKRRGVGAVLRIMVCIVERSVSPVTGCMRSCLALATPNGASVDACSVHGNEA